VSCGVGCRRSLDPALLWLWRRPVAPAPIQPLAWEPPYAAGAAQEIAKKKDKKKKKKKRKYTSQEAPKRQNQQDTDVSYLVHRERDRFYFKELAHTIVEAEKSEI